MFPAKKMFHTLTGCSSWFVQSRCRNGRNTTPFPLSRWALHETNPWITTPIRQSSSHQLFRLILYLFVENDYHARPKKKKKKKRRQNIFRNLGKSRLCLSRLDERSSVFWAEDIPAQPQQRFQGDTFKHGLDDDPIYRTQAVWLPCTNFFFLAMPFHLLVRCVSLLQHHWPCTA